MLRSSPTRQSRPRKLLTAQISAIQISPPPANCPTIQRISAAHRFCLGYPRQRQIRIARKLGHFQCPPKHADADRSHYNQRRSATGNCCRKLPLHDCRRLPTKFSWWARANLPSTVPSRRCLQAPSLSAGCHCFSRDYANPRIYTTNIGYEQQLVGDYALTSTSPFQGRTPDSLHQSQRWSHIVIRQTAIR